jgi:hypothetical protein
MLVGHCRVFVTPLAVPVGRSRMLLGFVVTPMFMMMRCLTVVMGSSLVIGRSVMVMYAGRMFSRSHKIFPLSSGALPYQNERK